MPDILADIVFSKQWMLGPRLRSKKKCENHLTLGPQAAPKTDTIGFIILLEGYSFVR